MIKSALVFIKQQLDQYLVNQFSLDQPVAILNHLVETDGNIAPKNKNRMVITMINLDHDTNSQFYGGQRPNTMASNVTKVNPAVHFNVDLLLTANFDDYEESLKFLNATIAFFQANSSFTKKNHPMMPAEVEKLNVEIENSNSTETHNLWGAMGAKYLPSIIYKARHITIDTNQVNAITTQVSQADTVVAP